MPDRIRWLGHATVLIELDGVRILTDPVLRSRVLHLRRAVPLELDELEGLDAVLVSHVHYDHLDLPSLRRLDRDVRLVVPKGAGPLVRSRGFRSVEEIVAGDDVVVGSTSVRAVPAEHGSSRDPGHALGRDRLRPRGLPARLLPGRHRPASRHGRPRSRPGRGAPAHLGLGPVARRRGTSTRAARPRRSRSCGPGSPSRSTGARTTRCRRRAGRRRPSSALPAEEFQRAAAELAPDVEVRVLPVGGELQLGQG